MLYVFNYYDLTRCTSAADALSNVGDLYTSAWLRF